MSVDPSEGATTTVDPPPPAGSAAGDINKEVAEALSKVNSTVREAVVKHLVDEKVEERKRQCLRAVALIREFRSKQNKIKPGNRAFDLTGKVTAESFTEQQVKEHKGLKEHIDRLEAALKGAFEKAEYDGLTKAIAKAEGKADKEEPQV